jgi:diadenosine tetraphosphate (Ap4A) HIT family hydrolase
MKKSFVDVKNARKGEYKKVIEEIAKTGKCPFCKENFKYHKKPIYNTRKGWFLTNNTWPYKNAKHHLIILGNEHKEYFSELTKSDFESVSFLVNWAIKKWDIKGGGLAMRFGDTNLTGASVSHIHFHIISPEVNKKTKRGKTVIFPIG